MRSNHEYCEYWLRLVRAVRDCEFNCRLEGPELVVTDWCCVAAGRGEERRGAVQAGADIATSSFLSSHPATPQPGHNNTSHFSSVHPLWTSGDFLLHASEPRTTVNWEEGPVCHISISNTLLTEIWGNNTVWINCPEWRGSWGVLDTVSSFIKFCQTDRPTESHSVNRQLSTRLFLSFTNESGAKQSHNECGVPLWRQDCRTTIPPARPSFHSSGRFVFTLFLCFRAVCVSQSSSLSDEGPPVVLSTPARRDGGRVLDPALLFLCGRTGTSAKVSVSVPPSPLPALSDGWDYHYFQTTSDRQISDRAAYELQTHGTRGVNRFGVRVSKNISLSSTTLPHGRNQRCNIWYLMWNVCIQCRVSPLFQ